MPTPSLNDSGRHGAPSRRRVAVVVVTYNAERYVEACFASLRGTDTRGLDVRVMAVDNGSSDATVTTIRERYPEVLLIVAGKNLGFAAGNNVAIERAIADGAEFVYLLNPDTEVTPTFLQEALAVMDAFPHAGAVQSLLLLASDPDRINTSGNRIHFLGFGYCGGFGAPAAEAPPVPVEIACASGAGALFRAEALREAGLLDDDLFLYQEDMDLSWRLRLAGWRLALAPRSIVYHEYTFTKTTAKFYYLERNRLLVLAKNLRLRTLLLLAPFLLLAEAGTLAIAVRGGWARQKVRATGHMLLPVAWRHIARGRYQQRTIRRVSDREIARLFTPTIEFDGVTNGFFEVAVNPAMRAAWRALWWLIR